jgi:recombination protein RecA
MAKRKDNVTSISQQSNITNEEVVDFSAQLIKDINKEMGCQCAYNLDEQSAPTTVKRWLGTGSIQLNYLIRNAIDGGYPEGRIIEISGLASSGKSHFAFLCSAIVQKMGGLVVYIDTENATMLEKLQIMGIDVKKRFVYVQTQCTEDVFKIIESTITKAKNLAGKNIPVLVVWDSIAATSPKAELDGDYDAQTMGLQARVISKGLRKITGFVGANNVTFLMLNQLRDKIGGFIGHGDPYVTPGGKAPAFHASVRLRIAGGQKIKDDKGNTIGITVNVETKKNKVAPPFRKCEFDIIYGRGIQEGKYIFDVVRAYCDDNKIVRDGKEIKISGAGGWKTLLVSNATTGEVIHEKSFHKEDFDDLIKDEILGQYVLQVIDAAYVLDVGQLDEISEGDSDVTVAEGEDVI